MSPVGRGALKNSKASSRKHGRGSDTSLRLWLHGHIELSGDKLFPCLSRFFLTSFVQPTFSSNRHNDHTLVTRFLRAASCSERSTAQRHNRLFK